VICPIHGYIDCHYKADSDPLDSDDAKTPIQVLSTVLRLFSSLIWPLSRTMVFEKHRVMIVKIAIILTG
jgi:hypothetical protein